VDDDEDPVGDDALDPVAVAPVLEDVLAKLWLPVEVDEPVELPALDAAGADGFVEPLEGPEWCELGLGFWPPKGSMYC
jgi:hypothetical protein